MRLEVGRRYIRRDGVIEGPLVACDDRIYPYTNPNGTITWTEDGQYHVGNSGGYDLVRPVRVYGLFEEIPLEHYRRGVAKTFESGRIL